MKDRFGWPGKRGLWLVLLSGVAAFGGGCSLLYEGAQLDQCSSTSDCTERGAAFAGTVCQANLCVTDPDPVSGDGDGSGGMLGGGGQGGAPPTAECKSNGECIDKNFGSPFLCREGKCVALTIPGECPIVVGAGQDSENLRQPDPIVIGAYSVVDPTAPRLSVPTLNYELAIDEVNAETRGGLPGGSNGTLRPFVAVICGATDDPDLDASLKHLTEDLQVPGIISSLYTSELVSAFQEYGAPNSTFFLSPLEADSTLTNIDDSGLLWHLLAPARDLAPAYVPLVAQAEVYIRRTRAMLAEDKLRVALVEASNPFLGDLAEEFVRDVRFNNASALQNETDGHLLRIRVGSALEEANPDTSLALAELRAFLPHVIVAMNSKEFVPLMGSLEAGWSPGLGERPFYLTSPYLFGRTDLASATLSPAHSRLLGVNFAGAADSSLYDLYLSKFKSTYDVTFSLEGSENFYDAAYYLMYSIAAAGTPPRLTGREVALGMTRLISGATEYEVGARDASDAIGTLLGTSTSNISLVGTMGPPDFNTSTGARSGEPSVYCISSGEYQQDVMVYDGSGPSLSGEPGCVEGFWD